MGGLSLMPAEGKQVLLNIKESNAVAEMDPE